LMSDDPKTIIFIPVIFKLSMTLLDHLNL